MTQICGFDVSAVFVLQAAEIEARAAVDDARMVAVRRRGHAVLRPDAPEPVWTRITNDDIRDALEAIEQVYRDVYILHTFDRLSYEQIAERLSIRRITVGTRLNRARKRLREVLVKRFGLKDRI